MSEIDELRRKVESMEQAQALAHANTKIDLALQSEAAYAPPIIGRLVKAQIGQLVADEDMNETRTATAVRSLLASNDMKQIMLKAQGATPIDPPATQRPTEQVEKQVKQGRKSLQEMLTEVKSGKAQFGMRH